MSNAIGLMLVGALLTAVSQVLLKLSANRSHATRAAEYLNGYVITAYVLLFTCMVLTILAFRVLDLKSGPIYASTSYLFMLLLGRAILRERVSWRKVAGNLLIVAGVAIFTLCEG